MKLQSQKIEIHLNSGRSQKDSIEKFRDFLLFDFLLAHLPYTSSCVILIVFDFKTNLTKCARYNTLINVTALLLI